MMIEITLLYFDGCPYWKTGLENLQRALDAEHINAHIKLLRIDSEEQAQTQRFLGSPSFRINGIDLWEEVRSHYSLSCRVYRTPAGIKGSPTVEMLRERLRQVISS